MSRICIHNDCCSQMLHLAKLQLEPGLVLLSSKAEPELVAAAREPLGLGLGAGAGVEGGDGGGEEGGGPGGEGDGGAEGDAGVAVRLERSGAFAGDKVMCIWCCPL